MIGDQIKITYGVGGSNYGLCHSCHQPIGQYHLADCLTTRAYVYPCLKALYGKDGLELVEDTIHTRDSK